MPESDSGIVDRLRAAGCVFAEEEAALLVEAASGDDLEELVRRRAGGEPLEIVLGWAAFDGLRIPVRPGVFVPRRRTELLVRLAAARAPRRLLDLGCGSGAVGAAVLNRVPDAEVWATELDPVAVACARLSLPPDRVLAGSWFDPLPEALRGGFDVIVANAPYVPTDAVALMPPEAREHEPTLALDGGADGVDRHRALLGDADWWLAPSGVVLIETGREQAALTAAAMRAVGLEATIETDDDLDATVVQGAVRGAGL